MARKLTVTALLLVTAALLLGAGTFAAFTATATNTGNFINAASISLEDNDDGEALYEIANAGPGEEAESCIVVEYTGAAATVSLSTPTASLDGLAPYVTLTVEKGTDASPTFGDCGSFVQTGGVFSGTLAAFHTAHGPDGSPLALTSPAGDPEWGTGDQVVYRFHVEVADDDAAQGEETGLHAFTWTAETVSP